MWLESSTVTSFHPTWFYISTYFTLLWPYFSLLDYYNWQQSSSMYWIDSELACHCQWGLLAQFVHTIWTNCGLIATAKCIHALASLIRLHDMSHATNIITKTYLNNFSGYMLVRSCLLQKYFSHLSCMCVPNTSWNSLPNKSIEHLEVKCG